MLKKTKSHTILFLTVSINLFVKSDVWPINVLIAATAPARNFQQVGVLPVIPIILSQIGRARFMRKISPKKHCLKS